MDKTALTSDKKISQQLEKVAVEENLTIDDVGMLWGEVPVGDMGDMNYLEACAQCILEVSNLVDDKSPDLDATRRMAKKYRVMAKLLLIKAQELEPLQ